MFKSSSNKTKTKESIQRKSDPDEKESTSNNTNFRILSWSDARRLLLEVLLDWEDEQNKKIQGSSNMNEEIEEDTESKRSISGFVLKCCNLDMLLSIILSISLLILSLFPLHYELDTFWDKSDIASGLIAVFFSIFSILLTVQRKIVARKSQNSGLRNCVRSFATFLSEISLNRSKSLRKRIFATFDNADYFESKSMLDKFEGSNTKNEGGLDEFRITSEMGTSLTDIYTVYRLSRPKSETNDMKNKKELKPEWHKVPSLLLVKGDIIALQVGDVVPANVELLDASLNITLMKGERVTLESLSSMSKRNMREKRKYPFSLPPGKLQFQPESRQLLDLCNSMRIFKLQETPLLEFLKQGTSKHKAPQIHRQINAIRRALFIGSFIIFILTCIIILSRGAISFETYSSHSSYTMTIPIISALSLLPFTSPMVLYFIEIWGTCRIMTNIHEFSDKNHDIKSTNCKVNGGTGFYIFVRYFLSALQSRFTTQSYHQKRYQSLFCFSNSIRFSVPPTNSYLLEKLGVVTALALVDDE